MNPVPMRAKVRTGDIIENAEAGLMWHQTTAQEWRNRMMAVAGRSQRHREAAQRIIAEYDADMEELREALNCISETLKKYPDFVGMTKQVNDTDNGEGGWVYFAVREADGAVKIGYSKNPSNRVKQFQTGAGPCYLAAEMPGTYKKESELHKRFAHRCVGGEWFAPNDEILDLIRRNPLF